MADANYQNRLRILREAVHPDLKPEIRADLAGNGWPCAEEAIRLKNEIGESDLGELFIDAFAALTKQNKEPAEQLLSKHQPAIEQLDKALEAPFWQIGDDHNSSWDEVGIPMTLFDSRQLTCFKWLSASLALAEGQPGNAATYMIQAATIGRLLCESHRSYLAFLIGYSWFPGTCHRAIEMTSHPAWTEDALVRLASLCDPWDAYNHLRLSLAGDIDLSFLRFLAAIEFPCLPDKKPAPIDAELLEILTKGHPNPFDAIDTARQASALVAQMLASLQGNEPEVNFESLFGPFEKAWPARFLTLDDPPPYRKPLAPKTIGKYRKRLLELDNPFGMFLIAQMMVSMTRAGGLIIKHRATTNALRLAIALARYRIRHAILPQEVSELVGCGLLEQIPLDPFSGEPFQYDRDNGLIGSPAAMPIPLLWKVL